MIDVFWWYITTLGFSCGIVGLFVFYRLIIGDKYLMASKQLSVKMANLRRDYPELSENRQEFVEHSLSGLGVEGVIASLIPKQYKALAPVIVPVATGFINTYLNDPAKLKGLADKLGVKLPDGTQNQTGFTGQM